MMQDLWFLTRKKKQIVKAKRLSIQQITKSINSIPLKMKPQKAGNSQKSSAVNSFGIKLKSLTLASKPQIPLKSSSDIITKVSSLSTMSNLKQQTKPQTQIKAPQEQKKEQNQIATIKPILYINTQLLKSSDLIKKIKEIEDINKQQAIFLQWKITTVFSNQTDVSKLTRAIAIVGPRVKSLFWEIKGNLSDAVGKTLGEILSQFTELYSLNLSIHTSFGIKFATSLSTSLKQLTNMRALNIDLSQSQLESQWSWYNVMLETISSLTKLDFMRYSKYHGYSGQKQLPLVLSNHVFTIDRFLKVEENQILCQQQVDLLKDRIVDLQFKYECCGGKGCWCFDKTKNNLTFYEIYTGLFSYFLELPYLTRLDTFIVFHEYNQAYQQSLDDLNQYDIKLKQSMKLERVFQEFLKQKHITVLKFYVFTENISTMMCFNPILILQDLYFD